nr:translation initiation factor IF-2-like [Aegilops tauschii subsp. strangulata]
MAGRGVAGKRPAEPSGAGRAGAASGGGRGVVPSVVPPPTVVSGRGAGRGAVPPVPQVGGRGETLPGAAVGRGATASAGARVLVIAASGLAPSRGGQTGGAAGRGGTAPKPPTTGAPGSVGHLPRQAPPPHFVTKPVAGANSAPRGQWGDDGFDTYGVGVHRGSSSTGGGRGYAWQSDRSWVPRVALLRVLLARILDSVVASVGIVVVGAGEGAGTVHVRRHHRLLSSR